MAEQTGTGVITSIEERKGTKGNFLRVEINKWHYSAFDTATFQGIRDNLSERVDFGFSTSDDGKYYNLSWVKPAEITEPKASTSNGMSKEDWGRKDRILCGTGIAKSMIEAGVRPPNLSVEEEFDFWISLVWGNGGAASQAQGGLLRVYTETIDEDALPKEPPKMATDVKTKNELQIACKALGMDRAAIATEANKSWGQIKDEDCTEIWQQIMAVRGGQDVET